MIRSNLRRPSATTVIACLALFVALGGVGYAAATVNSASVINNSLRSKDMRNENLRGKDIHPDTLKGADIDESSLGQVPNAADADHADSATSADSATNAANADTVGGVPVGELTVGRASGSGTCSPGGGFAQCANTLLTLPHEGRVLVTAGGQWSSPDPVGSEVEGECRIEVDGAAFTATTEEGSLAHQTDTEHEAAIATVTTVTDPLEAGPHGFRLMCSDEVGDMTYTDVRVTAVLLGSE